MVTNKERFTAETKIKRLQNERQYDQKLAELLEEKEKEEEINKIQRKKTDDVLFFAFRNAILIASFCIVWDIATNGFRWSWGY
jgi:hypothetical protein